MRLLGSVLAVTLLMGAASSAWSQEKSGSKSGSSKSGSKEKAEPKARGVLPMYYRQLGLSEEQRQKIYRIQNEYSDKIDELEKKIEDMKAERNGRYLKELTKAQRDRLDELKKSKDKEEEKK